MDKTETAPRPVNIVLRLADICEVKTKFPDADFWIVRKGTKDAVGKPTREFSPEAIGVKVKATEVIDPGYLYYWFQYLHHQGIFARIAHGTTRLQNIQTSDIRNIPATFKAVLDLAAD